MTGGQTAIEATQMTAIPKRHKGLLKQTQTVEIVLDLRRIAVKPQPFAQNFNKTRSGTSSGHATSTNGQAEARVSRCNKHFFAPGSIQGDFEWHIKLIVGNAAGIRADIWLFATFFFWPVVSAWPETSR
eukprot:6181945-Pleurochrysis_carterae.AAC.2